ncbi:hypothetical protein AAF712_014783 [Marasmius tenuissimus]|uniref:Uncharacterized protein n=1 Tax=Marasmius tenuissimus TaxID=585030 RepID=A0ABR2ZBZ2_9AGAR
MASPHTYLPNAMQTPGLLSRNHANGIYKHLTSIVGSMGKAALCDAEVGTDFHKRKEGKSLHYGFVDNNTPPRVYSANVFGEIVGASHGTLLGAGGTHYWGRDPENPTPITDATKVKQQIVLGVPSFAPQEIENLFRDQIVTMVNVRNADIDEEDSPVTAKEAIKCSSGDEEPDLLVLTMGQIYTTSREDPKGKGKDAASKQVMMKKRKAAQIDAPDDPQPLPQQVQDLSRPLADHELPPASAVRVGAEYPPNVLPDYGGPGFRHRLAKVKQPMVQDEGGVLIPIWEFWDKLRVGTLVMANVVIMVWVIQGEGSFVRKVYHLAVRSLRVLARSDISVTKPGPSSGSGMPTASHETVVHDAASVALQSLVIPGFDLQGGLPAGLSNFTEQSLIQPSSPAASASTITSALSGLGSLPEFVVGSSTGPGTYPASAGPSKEDFDMIDDGADDGLTTLEPEAENSCPKKKAKAKRN